MAESSKFGNVCERRPDEAWRTLSQNIQERQGLSR